jgi:flagellar L-ring protein precursor FlgH
MTHPESFIVRAAMAAVFFACACTPVVAQHAETAAQASAIKSSATYEELYQRYLVSARRVEVGPGTSIAWMTGLTLDRRARRVNDLVTIRVVESISASGTADSNLSKDSEAHLGVPNLFGLEKNLPSSMDPANLINANANTKFVGGGATNRAGELTAVMTARVAEVLPNGDLVLEGAREIAINGDRQMIVLTGVVRASDVLPNNTVLSTQIGQFSVRYFGNGLIKDSLKPGFLVRFLNKIF